MTELDLSQPVSAEDYRRALRSLLDQFEDWRQERGWCTDLYLFVGQLTTTFRWDKYNEYMQLDIPEGITGEERAKDLREIRGRILRFTRERNSYITLDRANRFLAGAGLPRYAPPEPAGRTFSFRTTGYIATDKTEGELRDALNASLLASGGQSFSIRLIQEEDRHVEVPVQDTTELIRDDVVRRAGY